MEQRPLRLGDIVDDYCTRERRVTNHVVVALVGDAIQLTRCTTCDTEHTFKGAKEPRLRKKPQAAELDDRVPTDVAGDRRVAASAADDVGDGRGDTADAGAALDGGADEAPGEGGADDVRPDDGWPAHRRLIRATLPRTENEPPPPRPIPEFTMHQRQPAHGRGFRFRGGGGGQGNGSAPNGFGHGRPGQPAGRPGRHRGKKRSR